MTDEFAVEVIAISSKQREAILFCEEKEEEIKIFAELPESWRYNNILMDIYNDDQWFIYGGKPRDSIVNRNDIVATYKAIYFFSNYETMIAFKLKFL